MIDKVYLMLPSAAFYSRAEQDARKEFSTLNNDKATNDLVNALVGEEYLDETSKERNARFKGFLKEERAKGRFVVAEDGTYNGRPDKVAYKPSIKLQDIVDASGKINIKKLSSLKKEVRDNLLLDTFLGVLNSPSVPQQMLKPGGFDEASKHAAISTILSNWTAEQLADYFGISKDKSNGDIIIEAYGRLNEMSKNEVKDIAGKITSSLNPLSFGTQAYFHSQNANGGKMIGVYAVGNSAHCVGEWGETKLRAPFDFLGYTLSRIDDYFDMDGDLISENLANFLAASVDNVKDPVLKALNQDTKTGDITNFLLRAGMPIRTVAVFMTAPYNEYSPQSDGEYSTEITEDDLIKAKVLNNSEELSAKDRIYLNSIKDSVGYLRYLVKNFSSDLTEITQNFRGDALSSAAGPSIGHNITRALKLAKLAENLSVRVKPDGKAVYNNPNFTIDTDLVDVLSLIQTDNYDIDSILETSVSQKSPLVYAATKTGVTGSNHLLRAVYPQLNASLLNMVTNSNWGLSRYIDLTRGSTDNNAKLIEDFVNDFISYQLSGTKFFGEHSVDYYLKEFPNKFKEIKEKYPEVINTNSFTKNLQVVTKKGQTKIKFSNAGNLTKGLKESIMNDWAMLLVYNREPNEGESKEAVEKEVQEIRNLGFQLFNYASHFGLTFSGPNSFIQLAPNVIRRAIRDYDRTVRELGSAKEIRQFVYQFIRNNLNNPSLSTPISINKIKIHLDNDNSRIPTSSEVTWARESNNNYEVSSIGDRRFSALNARFKKDTVIEGVDVGGRTIEDVYQSVIKKSGKSQPPAKDSKLYRELPETEVRSYSGNITPDTNTIFVFGSNPEGRHGAGAAKVAREKFGAVYGQGEGLQGSSYALPTKRIKNITPAKTGKMAFSYGKGKRVDVKADTTIEAIINGERTATTRYITDNHIDYWKDLKVGDIVAFTSSDEKTKVYVRITKPLTKLNSSTNSEEWSKKEGWSTEYFNSKVKPRIEKGEAYQMEYEFVDANGAKSMTPSQIIEGIKRLYSVAKQYPNKQFKVAYRNTTTTSLNGYTGLELIDMFLEAGPIPPNIVFSKEWVDTGKFNLSRDELEDFSYTEGYLPLWQEWARQNPQLIGELKKKAKGKTLTDRFANTRVNQARALADILNVTSTFEVDGNTISNGNPYFIKRFSSRATFPALYRVTDDANPFGVVYEASEVNNSNDGYTFVTYKKAQPLGIPNGLKEYYYGEYNPESRITETSAFEEESMENPPISYITNDEVPLIDEDFLGFEGEEEGSSEPVITTYDDKGNQTTLC